MTLSANYLGYTCDINYVDDFYSHSNLPKLKFLRRDGKNEREVCGEKFGMCDVATSI